MELNKTFHTSNVMFTQLSSAKWEVGFIQSYLFCRVFIASTRCLINKITENKIIPYCSSSKQTNQCESKSCKMSTEFLFCESLSLWTQKTHCHRKWHHQWQKPWCWLEHDTDCRADRQDPCNRVEGKFRCCVDCCS